MLVCALLVLAADQVSKYFVSISLPAGGVWSPLPGPLPVFRIVHAYNTGAAFGLFQHMNPLFIAVAIIVCFIILGYAHQLRGDQRLLGVALGFILGGSLGNLIDRLRLGQVLDFIDLGVGTTRWYTSNIADASIVLGVIVLGLAMLREDRRTQAAASNGPELPSV
jgi:signal peptidase II